MYLVIFYHINTGEALMFSVCSGKMNMLLRNAAVKLKDISGYRH